jgi:hypothetical protein
MFVEVHILCSLFVAPLMFTIMQRYHRWYPLVFVGYNLILVPVQYAYNRHTFSAMQLCWVVFLLRATKRFPGVLSPTECAQAVLLLMYCGTNSLRRNLSLL